MHDFSGLSDYDFELLVADLLRAHWDAEVESFPRGRDGGVDLRVLGPHEGLNLPVDAELVVQCKHHPGSAMTAIRASLKREASSSQASVNAFRYVLATSTRLTRKNKIEISGIFEERVAITDIFGRDNINALLRLHPEVERAHPKLWMTSAAVLEAIIHNAEFIRTQSLVDDLQRLREKYVETPVLEQAEDLLAAHGICLLTGPPGVGKTATAMLLLIKLMAQGWQPIVAVANVKELETQIDRARKQVLFFDDFLGQNSLTATLDRGEESELLRLMRAVESDEMKILILTTRSYLLEQAKQSSEKLSDDLVSKVALSVKTSQLTREQRAHIIYNLIYFSPLRESVSSDKSAPRRLARLAEHNNYNPRLVDAAIASVVREMREHNPPRQLGLSARKARDQEVVVAKTVDLVSLLERSFANPASLWQHVLKQLNSIQRTILSIRVSFGTQPTSLKLLLRAVDAYLQRKDGHRPVDSTIKQALAVLEGDLLEIAVSTSRDGSIRRSTRILNPGLTDAITSDINQDEGRLLDLALGATDFIQIQWLVEIYQQRHKSSAPAGAQEAADSLGRALYEKAFEQLLSVSDPEYSSVSKSLIDAYISAASRLRTIARICSTSGLAPSFDQGAWLEDVRVRSSLIPRSSLLDIRVILGEDSFQEWTRYRTGLDDALTKAAELTTGEADVDDLVFLSDVINSVSVSEDWRDQQLAAAIDWIEERVQDLDRELDDDDMDDDRLDEIGEAAEEIESAAARLDIYCYELDELKDRMGDMGRNLASVVRNIGERTPRLTNHSRANGNAVEDIFRRL